ncbi:hypothetical protein LTR37_019967 [Vermiconidia calcicola]|uniref:Uncharacterized protein n=1 Tax=Vermiconidia calcicola TaxID=1690605 RepID=A0ACC3MDV0_9PEZI|nr:hypothetical protein LTR37_019967 [Vermiconidia calcicola]
MATDSIGTQDRRQEPRASKSMLQALPPEIRNRIFNYALQEDRQLYFTTSWHKHIHKVNHSKCRSGPWCRNLAKEIMRLLKQPALTRTSKEIRAETLLVYYDNLTLLVPFEAAPFRDVMLKWLKSIGPESRKNVRGSVFSHPNDCACGSIETLLRLWDIKATVKLNGQLENVSSSTRFSDITFEAE